MSLDMSDNINIANAIEQASSEEEAQGWRGLNDLVTEMHYSTWKYHKTAQPHARDINRQAVVLCALRLQDLTRVHQSRGTFKGYRVSQYYEMTVPEVIEHVMVMGFHANPKFTSFIGKVKKIHDGKRQT